MTALAILGIVALLLLAPLAVAAVRQRTLFSMALRNIGRRRAEAVLVVAGALLGTAIITSSLVVGDVIEASFADVARTEYGPIDITLTPMEATLEDVETAVAASDVDGIDGLLAVITATATLEAPKGDVAVPQVQVVELDLAAARNFGSDPTITGVADAGDLGAGQIVINERTAGEVDAVAGDELRLHAYGSAIDVKITRVVQEVGLAGYGGVLVPPGTIAGLAEDATGSAASPRHRLLVSLDGGVFDTRAHSDAVVTDLRDAVAGVPGVEVEAPKALVLDDADRQGAGLTEVFSLIGIFSVLAGILLLINLFVMLAEERKTELGMLRAVGFTRRRLTRAFAIEGAFYAITAAVLGAVAGLGVGWLVAVVAGPIFGADEGSSYPLTIEPMSLAIGASTGLVISLVTIWVTSLRIARLNIIRAIRDLPEPKVARARTRTVILGAVGIVVGAAAASLGYVNENPFALVLGVPVMALSAAPLLRRLLPERSARLLVAGTVLAWGLLVYPLFPDIMGGSDMLIFVVQGVVLTVGAVSLASSLDRVWTSAVEHLGRGGRGLAPRLGIAYPLARRFRTSMLLGMFSLVIFTVTILTSFSVALGSNTDATVEQVSAGFDVMVDTNPTSPIDADELAARDDVAVVAGLARGVANFGAAHLDGTPEWAVSGFDLGLLKRGTPALFRRDEAYASDVDVYLAVLNDPSLAIVPENFLVAGVDVAVLEVGDTFDVIEPGSGQPRELTIAALGETDWLENGALVSRELTTELFGEQDIVTRYYVGVAEGADADAVASSVNAAFLEQGADADTFMALINAGASKLTGFLALLRGFLGFGLLVGIAGLGVVMVRAVRERRQEIGMLRAMGFRAGLIRTAMLSEAGLIAVQGTIIGAVLGLITTRQLLLASDSFGDVPIPFIVPWVGLAVILALPLVASLAVTVWPATRAARIKPAVALRIAD